MSPYRHGNGKRSFFYWSNWYKVNEQWGCLREVTSVYHTVSVADGRATRKLSSHFVSFHDIFFRVFLHECYLRRQTLKMPNSYLKQYMFLVNLHWVFFSIALIKGHLELILIITIIALILLQTVKLILLLKFVFCSYFEVSSQFA